MPRPDVKINRVERNRVNLHQHLSWPRLGPGQLADLDILRRSRLFDVCSFHGEAILVWGTGIDQPGWCFDFHDTGAAWPIKSRGQHATEPEARETFPDRSRLLLA